MKIGLRVKLQDPDDPTQIINAQFATVRSNPQLKDMLTNIARLDVAESVALKKLQQEAKDFDETEDNYWLKQEAVEKLEKARLDADAATAATLEAVHAFVVAGFKLAGATDERAEELASIVDIEKVDELKARCVYGAGCLDFTKAAGH
jgi:hypothetical protein